MKPNNTLKCLFCFITAEVFRMITVGQFR